MTIKDPTRPMSCPVAHDEIGQLIDLDQTALARQAEHIGALRDQGPVVWVPKLDAYAVTTYKAALTVLNDPVVFSSALGDPKGPRTVRHILQAREQLAAESAEFHEVLEKLNPDWRREKVLSTADLPDHTNHRRLVNRLFTPRRVADMQTRVREIADDLIDSFCERGRADASSEFAVALPMRVIAEQLGVGDGDLDAFKRWSDDLVFAVGNDNPGPEDVMRITQSLVEISDFFRAAFADRRRNPRNDFVTVLATAEDPDWTPTDEHRISIISQMLGAGNETATKMITSGIARLASSPALASRLRSDDALVKSFVEELLRIDSPVQGLYRLTSIDTVLEGVPIPAGSAVWVVFASGNRDGDVFPQPEMLDVDRANSREHLAFGRGIHFCPGAPLARMEGFVAFSALLERVYPWTIEDFKMEHSYVLYGYRRLDIAFEPGPARNRTSPASLT